MANQMLKFEVLSSVSNPNSIHGLYPYRGKISGIDAQKIISQFNSHHTLLDPFCGSGTIVYEAQKQGMNAIGIDSNPIAINISKAKTELVNISDNNKYINEALDIIGHAKRDMETLNYSSMPSKTQTLFHPSSANEIMCVKNYFDQMSDYVKGAYFGSIALTARGNNNYKWTSSTVGKNIEPKRYISFFDKFIMKTKKHSRFLNNSKDSKTASILKADSRYLNKEIPDNSIDVVFTSPPYFDALDYTAYYAKLIYDIHNVDRLKIKNTLIQSSKSYKTDMELVLHEMDRITKDNSIIVFVVGDKKTKNEIINGGEFFSNIWKASYIEERHYSGSSSKIFDSLNKTKRKEQIVVWEKKDGEVIYYE